MEAQPADPSREALIDAILAFLADQDLLTLQDIRAALAREIDDAGPDAVLALEARLVADSGWDYYPRRPRQGVYRDRDDFADAGRVLDEARGTV